MILKNLLGICFLALCGASGVAASTPDARHDFHYENVLGTSLELHVQASSPEVAEKASDLLLKEIDRLSGIVSTWSADSELSRAMSQAGTGVPVSADLAAFLKSCEQWQTAGKGAFNPRVATFASMWKQAEATQTLPTTASLAEVARQVSAPAWKVDASNQTVNFIPGAKLTFDAIAKGWIIDQAGDAVLKAMPSVKGMMLNIGGDLRLWGDLAETVAVANPKADAENARPLATINMRGQAMATSGGYRRGWTIQGQLYSHLLNPTTGLPAAEVQSASVIAPDAATADVLATIFSVLPVSQSLALTAELPGVHCLLVNPQGQTVRSPGWQDAPLAGPLLVDAAPAAVSTDGAAPAAAGAMELLVDFELRAHGGKYHRPYVAVWVEDKDGFPLRTMILWIQQGKDGLKYLRDLKRWHKVDKVRQSVDPINLVQTISSATRRAGQYSAIWDGKDDGGNAVKPGSYTLYIEAAREKGTYQIIKHDFTWGGEAYLDLLEGNVEVSSAALEIRPKSAK